MLVHLVVVFRPLQTPGHMPDRCRFRCAVPAPGHSLRRQLVHFAERKSEDLAYNAFSLIRFEKELSVRGAVENDQLFWFGCFLVLRSNSEEPWPVATCVIACHDSAAVSAKRTRTP
jgi:hypothetical protein